MMLWALSCTVIIILSPGLWWLFAQKETFWLYLLMTVKNYLFIWDLPKILYRQFIYQLICQLQIYSLRIKMCWGWWHETGWSQVRAANRRYTDEVPPYIVVCNDTSIYVFMFFNWNITHICLATDSFSLVWNRPQIKKIYMFVFFLIQNSIKLLFSSKYKPVKIWNKQDIEPNSWASDFSVCLVKPMTETIGLHVSLLIELT